jgi:chromosome segregation ATPase
MTITEGIVVAFLGMLAAVISGLLAARNAGKQVRAERDRAALEDDTRRDELLASVNKEATGAARQMYQELCTEQQKRITQQHNDIGMLAADVGLLRGQLVQAQSDMAATRRELVLTQDELRTTRAELQATRDLLESTKQELLASRAGQRQLEVECVSLRTRVKDLETELARYKAKGD